MFSILTVEHHNPVTDSWKTLAIIKLGGTVAICSIGDRLICTDELVVIDYVRT